MKKIITLMMTLLFPLCGWAEKGAYALLNDDNTVLTFYYGDGYGMYVGPFAYGSGRGWDVVCNEIKTVVFDASFAQYTELTSTANWFDDCINLSTVQGLENLNTANVTDMHFMFSDCSSLKTLNLSSLDVSSVKSMRMMFQGCRGLESLVLSGWNTESVEDMYGMFMDCSALTTLNLSSFNTKEVTDMADMFAGCDLLENLDVSSFNTSKVTSMRGLFLYCQSMPTLHLSNFNTEYVKDMSYMFSHCQQLTTIYVGDGWTTAAVKVSEHMFSDCYNLVGCAGTSFNTMRVDDATYACVDGGEVAPGYLSNQGYVPPEKLVKNEGYAVLSEDHTQLTFFYDDKKESRSGMSLGPFDDYMGGDRGWNAYSSMITEVVFDPSFANELTLTSTAWWFCGFYTLTTITGLEYLNTSEVKDMRYMFYGCMSLESLDLTSFDTSEVTNMMLMFSGCESLKDLKLSGFNTNNVEDMESMFNFCKALKTLDVSDFNTSKVKTMKGMFSYLESIETIDLSKFDTSNVLNMENMFEGCQSLTYLKIDKFNTESLTDMSEMFFKCESLQTLDLSSFDTKNVTDMNHLFTSCYKLTTIYVGEKWSTSSINVESGTSSSNVPVGGGNYVFTECPSLIGGMGTKFDDTHIDYSYAHIDGGTSNPGYLTDISRSEKEQVTAPQITHEESLISITCETEGAAIYYTTDGSDPTTEKTIYTDSFTVTENCTVKAIAIREGYYDSEVSSLVVDWIVIGTPCGYAVLSDSGTTLMFYYDSKKDERNGMDIGPFSYMNFKPTTSWYAQASNITKVVFDPSFAECTSITSTAFWFYGFNNLKTIIGIANLKTDNVVDMSHMFQACSSLTSLDVNHFNTSNVNDMASMFASCSSLKSLDVTHFDTSNVTNMGSMFSGCSGLTSLDLSHFDTSNVTSMSWMFYSCSGLKSLDVSLFDTSNVTSMQWMFYSCSGLTNLDVSKFNTEKVEDMSTMFYKCSALKYLDVSNFNTANVTSMAFMFSDCNSLIDLDVSHFNTSKVTNMSCMFQLCQSLTKLDVDNFDTSKVTSMNSLFSHCRSLVSLDVSKFNTSKVTNMASMFQLCELLTKLDVSNFDTSKVTDMENLFSGCKGLISLNVKSWYTTNVIYMSGLFCECSSLTTLDLSSFNTSNVTLIGRFINEGRISNKIGEYVGNGMFQNCSKLKTIYVSNRWSTESVTYDGNMFIGCSNLVGGKGTTYNYLFIDKTYARIDGGYSAPGYFTEKTVILGDANGDGVVDQLDADAIARYIMGDDVADFDHLAADANEDGKINVADITVVVNIIRNSAATRSSAVRQMNTDEDRNVEDRKIVHYTVEAQCLNLEGVPADAEVNDHTAPVVKMVTVSE